MTTQTTIQIGSYTFEGPHSNTGSLRNAAGVYVILCAGQNNYTVTDVGESGDVKTRVDNHDRADCWKRNCSTQLSVAVLYTPNLSEAMRRAIESEIRTQYRPACGTE